MDWPKAVAGGIVGGLIGLPVGLALAILCMFTIVPTSLWNEALLLPGLTGLFAAPFVGVGVAHGGAPTDWTARVVFLFGRFVAGMLGGMALAVALAGLAAWAFSISQREGAYAMGVAFVIMPFGGLVGGLALTLWSAFRLRARASRGGG